MMFVHKQFLPVIWIRVAI